MARRNPPIPLWWPEPPRPCLPRLQYSVIDNCGRPRTLPGPNGTLIRPGKISPVPCIDRGCPGPFTPYVSVQVSPWVGAPSAVRTEVVEVPVPQVVTGTATATATSGLLGVRRMWGPRRAFAGGSAR